MELFSESDSRLFELRRREWEIQEELKKDLPLTNGRIDFMGYDCLMGKLRELRAGMASLQMPKLQK